MPMATAALTRSPALSFALAAFAWGLGLFAVLRLPWIEAHGVLPVTALQGQLAAALSGTQSLPVAVTLACSGTDVLAMCLGAILAYPVRWRLRLAGAAGGVAIILALNVVRIATLGRATVSPPLFEVLHVFIWPAALALCAAAYVFVWMRAAGAAADVTERREAVAPTRMFVLLAAAFIVMFAAASPLYLESAWVGAVAVAIAQTAAVILRFAGIAAVATANVLVTARGGVTVTQECISTPLIPVYLAAVLAYVTDWRRRAPMLLAVVPIFFALGVARLLVIAIPGALAGSSLFFIHAFYQLLTGVVVVVGATYWQHGLPAAWRHAGAALFAGAVALAVLMPLSAMLVSRWALPDPQGATVLLPAFQGALLIALWIALRAAGGWRPFLMSCAALALVNVMLFAGLRATDGFDLLASHVPAVRAWALVLPMILMAGLRRRAHSRG